MDKTFDEIAEEQGWSDQSLVFLLRQFIAEQRLYEELDRFAQHIVEDLELADVHLSKMR